MGGDVIFVALNKWPFLGVCQEATEERLEHVCDVRKYHSLHELLVCEMAARKGVLNLNVYWNNYPNRRDASALTKLVHVRPRRLT